MLGDGSSVIGELVAKQPSPEPGSIPWLLLKVKSHGGAGKLDGTNFIRRVDTNGGAEPAAGCDAAHQGNPDAGCDAAHQGNPERVPYTATYQFFGP